jgi:hypothetical protein
MDLSLVNDLHNKIYTKCIRYTKEECLDLPETMNHLIPIKMSSKLEENYKEVQKKVIAEIDTVKGKYGVNILGILAQLTKLQQITTLCTLYLKRRIMLIFNLFMKTLFYRANKSFFL